MKLEFISQNGTILPLTNNPRFKLTNVDGMTIANVELSSSSVSSMDGDFINNKRTTPRSIVLDLAIENDVENTARYILNVVKAKKTATLRWTQNERVVEIKGVVEQIDMPRFTNSATMQITLYCSQPYWEDIDDVIQEISEIIDLHYFTEEEDDMLYFPEEGIPFGEYDTNRTKVFNNSGDVDVGLEIRIIALGSVVNPIIYNSKGEFIGVNVSLNAGDQITITTGKGHKTITLNGNNILSSIKERSTWLQLDTGTDEFTISSQSGVSNMYFTIGYKQRYI